MAFFLFWSNFYCNNLEYVLKIKSIEFISSNWMWRKVMFLFIWRDYLNVSLMDFIFLESSVFLYIAFFVELCLLAILFAFGGNFAGHICAFFGLLGRFYTFQEMKTFLIKVYDTRHHTASLCHWPLKVLKNPREKSWSC